VTDHEWDSFVRLCRELLRAYADLATMRTMLTTSELAEDQNRPDMAMKAVRGWMARLEKSRAANFYAKYLAKGEAHIAQAEPDRSDELLIQLLSQDRPRIFPLSAPIQRYGCAARIPKSIGEKQFFPCSFVKWPVLNIVPLLCCEL